MALTPDEIRSRQFHLADRGYDRAEVHAFLAEVAAQVAEPSTTPWPAAEERLLLILEAADRAVARVRDEAADAIRLVALAADRPPAPPAVDPVERLRHRLGAALRDVESALGSIDDDGRPAT